MSKTFDEWLDEPIFELNTKSITRRSWWSDSEIDAASKAWTEALRLADWLDGAYEGDAQDSAAELRRLHFECERLRADAERYRWLCLHNVHHVYNKAWLNSITATKEGPCDIFSSDEIPELLDAEIDRRMVASGFTPT